MKGFSNKILTTHNLRISNAPFLEGVLDLLTQTDVTQEKAA